MKNKMMVLSAMAASLLVSCVSEKNEHHDDQAELMSQAAVSKDDAQKTALATVQNGTIKESELEKEHGKLIWSFDIATPDSKDITEVNVDAKTGKLVSVEKESAKSEVKEAAHEKN